MVSEETIQAKKEQAEQEKLIKYMQGYFDTKRDEDGMMNFVKLMNLGCFGKEFHAYGIAYEDEYGPAYRVSGNVSNLYEFIKYSGVDGYRYFAYRYYVCGGRPPRKTRRIRRA